jgi:cytochrome c oxidase assembly protein subunit 15
MKAWIEMIHRYLAMGIGVLIVALMLIAWRKWLKSARRDARSSPVFPTALFAFICLQGAFGAWTVTMKLQPVIVTIHLLLGVTLLALLTWFGARLSDHPSVSQSAAALRIPAALAILLLVIQIALGGWVSSNYAALACPDFPLCQGALLPQMDFVNGFSLWRNLGMTAKGDYLPFPALTAIHWTHRAFAFIVVMLAAWVALNALKIDGLRKTARWLLVMIALQFTIGVSTIFLKVPLALAVAHNGGAALLMLLLVTLNYKISIATGAASN